MIKTVGISGYGSTGSSAYVDLLHEFDETQVLDREFKVTWGPDGLEDLEQNLRNPTSCLVAIERFRIATEMRLRHDLTKSESMKLINDFLNTIIQQSWTKYQFGLNMVHRDFVKTMIKKIIRKLRFRGIRNKVLYNKIDISIMPENFSEASMNFISSVLGAMGIDNNNEKNVIVLNQAFSPYDSPVRSYKFFENPYAIIVDRDPRDIYLFCKFFLYPRGVRLHVPCDNVDDFIKNFHLIRQTSQELKERKDIMFLNFEELVYDYDNTAKKVADFVGITKHARKGECFNPACSRNNSQLFRKYTDCGSDIKKIEKELSEYLFPFENYPDIEPVGRMFWNSQIRPRF
jgi:hypothetical protein